ncbi:hypothetical protein CLHUN_01820 [Ruminiclostridium hungatei]|uniref:Uncharacterized protein n=1 Tax=Ruminiclostridium hungatei TaxID=48256 RepID=A0A1V4SSC1_RUMHU|nr:hypothetical protein [Ruminiclostridium hungatei]OPX46366.1 hypothetical protein CLHUN_01820 [Ruminiclostridium hungatei]
MDRHQYISWYKGHYGHMPPQKLLDKYYPIVQKEDVIPEPTLEEREAFWREE